jgi:membrane fusion protein, heavy metal efflux system
MPFSFKARSTRTLVAVAAVLACLVLVVIVLAARGHGTAAPVAEATPEPAPSGYFKPTADDWDNLTFTQVETMPFPAVDQTDGTIAAADDTTTQVFSPYTGRVTAVFPTVGDTVTAGEPLFAVEGSELAQAQNDLTTALQNLRAARIQFAVIAQNRRHLLALGNAGGAASKDVEQSAADLATAQTAVRNDEVAVALVRSRLRVLGVSDTAANRIANKQPAMMTLGTAVIVPAPAAGTITQRGVGVGQQVDSAANGSTSVLFTITDLSRVFFVAAVPETSIANVHIGDPVTVHMIAFPDHTFTAHVTYIAPVVDPSTHRIFVRSEVTNPDGELKPGMFGNMTIAYATATEAISVPEDAVIFEDDTARVWITGPNKTLALRFVHAGKTVNGMVEVLAGLRPGDHVVTSGSIFIDRALRGGD